MSKLRKATKRITAVAAASAMVASSVFAASLGSYPNNFVKDGKFNGQVVVGAAADAMDATNANAIIEDLKAEFSGESDKVKITYKKKSTADGDSFNVVKSNSQLNYGETLDEVSETLDDGDVDFLEDGTFDNGKSDEDYTQEIELSSGEFNYALRDEVDGVDEIADGVFYESGDTYLTYTLEFDSAIELNSDSDDNDKDFVGKVLEIMGNEFTIASISASSGNITELELIGGANKISLGEGESTTVEVDGKDYEVEIQSVSEDEVLLTVNGQSQSIDEYDTEDVSGISIAVTDLVESSRDSVKGYAEIVVGGQKLTLEDDGEVQVNEEDVSDLYEDYMVESTIDNGGFTKITIKYSVDDDTLLEEDDALIDPLFQGFNLMFEGTNEPEYSTIELTSADDNLKVDGELINGNDFNREMFHLSSEAGTAYLYLKGSDDEDRIFHEGSNDAIDTDNSPVLFNMSAAGKVTLDFTNTDLKGSGLFVYDDEESQYLYEVSSVDTSDKEVDFDEILDSRDEEEIGLDDLADQLEVDLTGTAANADGDSINVTLASKAEFTSKLAFANEMILDFSTVEDSILTATHITFDYDAGDVDGDDAADESDNINVTFDWDSDDDELDIKLVGNDGVFVNEDDAEIEDGNDDTKVYVTAYGTKYEHDDDEYKSLKVMVPEEQVEGYVSLVTGKVSSSEMTTIVDADKVEETKAELEDDGYTIVDTEDMASEEVEFDVTSAVLDSEVSGADDMIVVGGPAVNAVARELMGIDAYTIDQAGVKVGEGIIKFYEDENSVLVYGYSKEDTTAAVLELNNGGLSGDEKRI